MRILQCFPCDHAILRSQLKHTWLENQLTNKSEDDIVFLRQGPGWATLEREFPARVAEAEILACGFETGFSPAQLVDRLSPLADLAGDTKEMIKQAVHAAYLEHSGIADLKEPLNKSVFALREEFDRFLTVWKQPVSDQSEQELRQAWRKLYSCAEGLRDILNRLPRGIVLP